MWWARAGGVALKAMGIDKSGTQTLASSNAWIRITGWSVRSTFTDTVIDAGGTLTITANGTINYTFRGAFVAGSQQFRLVKNGAMVGLAASSGTVTSGTVAVAVGDVLELQAFTSSNAGSFGTVAAGATVTYLYFTVS